MSSEESLCASCESPATVEVDLCEACLDEYNGIMIVRSKAFATEPSLFKRHLDEVINPCWNFAGRCDSHKDEVMNTVLGIGGEAGEIVDQVKKMYFHTQKPDPFHREKLVSELGDSFFYHIKFMSLMGITLEEVLLNNAQKLASRHPELGKVTERFGEGYIK